MITGSHVIFFTPEAEELRTFIKEKLRFPATDAGGGWLLFDLPPGDLGCHPSERSFHELSFRCDDLKSTVEELKARGVEFTREIVETGWGWMTRFRMPGGVEADLYQAKYSK